MSKRTDGKRSLRAIRKLLYFRLITTAVAALTLTASFGMIGCSSTNEVVNNTDRVNAKQVIMAAGDLFTMMDLELTDKDSPVTISQDDPRFADFFAELQQYKKVADLDVKDLSITATIQAVHANTAREDSQQINYRYTITDVRMTVNGIAMTYNPNSGFATK